MDDVNRYHTPNFADESKTTILTLARLLKIRSQIMFLRST